MNRRELLKVLGITVGHTLLCSAHPLVTWAHLPENTLLKRSKMMPAMGTFVQITCFHGSEAKLSDSIHAAFETVDFLEHELSRHDTSSHVVELNQSGRLHNPSNALLEVLQTCKTYYLLSGKRFDVSVLPMLKAIEEQKSAAECLNVVDFSKVMIKEGQIRYEQKEMGITLDGAAKGYIVDKAAEQLQTLGIEHYLINAGGDIRCSGAKPGQHPWRIAIQGPARQSGYEHKIAFYGGALATSGSYDTFFSRNKDVMHLINPLHSKDYPLRSVTVSARSAFEADILSTTCFVMGAKQGMAFLGSIGHAEGLFILESGKVLKTRNWASHISL